VSVAPKGRASHLMRLDLTPPGAPSAAIQIFG
jgi:hypothetical protein